MPTSITHAIVAYTISKVAEINQSKITKKIITLTILISLTPDIDSIFFIIPHSPPLWDHRGIFHSFFFCLIISIIFIFVFLRKEKTKIKYFFLFFISASSHILLDCLNPTKRGVGLFSPFDNRRFSLPIEGLPTSPLLDELFTHYLVDSLLGEFKFIVLPCALILIVSAYLKKRRHEQ